MITVKYEEYWNDYRRKDHLKVFGSLTSLENWIFDQMQQKYQNNNLALYFPKKGNPNFPGRIDISPVYGGPCLWIHLIENERGIIFSDGKLTCGAKHASKQVVEWLEHCTARRDNPNFCFAD